MGTDVVAGRRDLRVVAGVLSYIFTSALIALLAAVELSSEDYTIFMAYTSVIGVLLLGPSAAIEQQSTLLTLRHKTSVSDISRHVILPSAGLATCIILVIFVPIQDWQQNAFGPHTNVIRIAMLTGVPLLLFSSIVRGHANGLSGITRVGNSHFIFAATTLGISIVSWQIGLGLLTAILIGQLAGWLSPGVYLSVSRATGAVPQDRPSAGSGVVAQSVLLVLSNLLLLANLLVSQFTLRLHATDIGVDRAAESQLVMSLSFVACALALGLMPTLIQEARRKGGGLYWRSPITMMIAAAGFAIPLLTVVLGKVVVQLIRGHESNLSYVELAAFSAPSTSLVLTVLVAATLVARELLLRTILVWSASLGLVMVSVEILGGDRFETLAYAFAAAFVFAPILMALATKWGVDSNE